MDQIGSIPDQQLLIALQLMETQTRTRSMQGKIGNIRGELAERAVYSVLAEGIAAGKTPSWLLAVTRATPEQDRVGIDIIVTADVGPLPLQVKTQRPSSTRHYRERGIGVVVAGPGTWHHRRSGLLRTVLHVLQQLRWPLVCRSGADLEAENAFLRQALARALRAGRLPVQDVPSWLQYCRLSPETHP